MEYSVVVGGDSLAILFTEVDQESKKSSQIPEIMYRSFRFIALRWRDFFGIPKNRKKADPESLLGKFMNISLNAKTVICYRVAPLQKVESKFPKITVTIFRAWLFA